MRPDEAAGLGDLAGDAARGASDGVREIHYGIARRVFDSVPGSAPVRIVHDLIANGVYTAVGRSAGTLARAGVKAAALGSGGEARSIHSSPAGRTALGALNAAIGDRLERDRSALALPMTLRVGAADIDPEPAALAAAFAEPSGRLAVFVHGLGQTDESWTRGGTGDYGARLHAELGYTPLYVRYNTGRHVSVNGRELAELLGRVTSAWPVQVDELVLIGHSIGGLVARSACHYGHGAAWTAAVRHVVTLGTPHEGTTLERAAHAASALLARLPETRVLAHALERRSAGIKDLGRAYLVDEDWRARNPRALTTPKPHAVPFLKHAEHTFLAIASARHRVELTGDPAVYEQIRARLSQRAALSERKPALPAAGDTGTGSDTGTDTGSGV
jgi:pimeloyl-ACP methyl ester carboxylesterase